MNSIENQMNSIENQMNSIENQMNSIENKNGRLTNFHFIQYKELHPVINLTNHVCLTDFT